VYKPTLFTNTQAILNIKAPLLPEYKPLIERDHGLFIGLVFSNAATRIPVQMSNDNYITVLF
jgi:hypothetical protein